MHDQPAPLCRALEQRIACTISLRDLESTPRLGAGKHGAVRKNGVHGQFAVACVGCRKQCGSAWLVLDGQHVSSPRQWPARGKTCARAFLVTIRSMNFKIASQRRIETVSSSLRAGI